MLWRPSFVMSRVIESLERTQLKRVPHFQAGDRVKVHFQVVEGTRRRTQVFEGVVLKRQGTGVRETFTVRKQSFGVGVERTFPLHSPKIERIEVASRGDVRRAKLYYLRGRVGRRARVRERQYTGPEPADVIPQAFDEQGPQAEAEVLTPEEAEAAEPAEAAETEAGEIQADATETEAAETEPATEEAAPEEVEEPAVEESDEPAAEAAEEPAAEADAPAADEPTEEASGDAAATEDGADKES
jgi:large subunit ribosomal protein L19